MTPTEFDLLVATANAELISAFKNGKVEDLDVYTKMILDYQQVIAKELFKELYQIRIDMTQIKGDLLKDSRLRFEEIMKKLP